MTIDATATRHLPAEPKPGLRWPDLAQGVLRTMTEETKERAAEMTDAAKIVFTSKMTWALLVGALMLGSWVRGQIDSVARVGEGQAEILTAVQEIQKTLQETTKATEAATRDRAELRVQIEALREELDRQNGERRLLEDFIEGRIGKIPYNPGRPGGPP